MKEKLYDLLHLEATKTIISSLISIAIGVLFGFIIMVGIALTSDGGTISDAFKGLTILLQGPFSSTVQKYVLTSTGDVIFYAVPLIFTGLSVSIAYKTGLFNIGAPGQYVMGTIGSLLVALYLHSSSAIGQFGIWLLAVLTGTLLGALWGVIPGVLKAFFDINEVIICIMTNWIAANLSSWIFKYTTAIQSTENTKGGFLMKPLENYTPRLGLDKLFPGSYIDSGIFIAIIVAIIIYVILNKTTFGFELKACGSNKNAAKYAGLNEKRNIIISIAIAGALAGMGASLYYLNSGIEYKFISQYAGLPAYGFNGIASAFLANCNPIGVVFSSLFIRYLSKGGEYLVKVKFNRYVADFIVSVIIYMAGFTRIIREKMLKDRKRERNKQTGEELKPEGGKKA